MTDCDWKVTRRVMMTQTALAGLGLAIPWANGAFAQPTVKAPVISFQRSKTGEGAIGPYGEVNIFKVGNEVLPVFAAAIDGSAVMDLRGRSAFVRYGKDPNAITLTATGVAFGKAKARPWSNDIVRELIAALAKDRNKAHGVMLLRSALYTSYPVAVARSKSAEGQRVGATMTEGARGYGSRAMICTTRTITETVTSSITETVSVIATAEKQYHECYDRLAKQNPCALAGPLAGVCAAAACNLITFVDMVVGFVKVVTTVAEEVTREVVTCVLPRPGEWPNPWTTPTRLSSLATPQPKAAFGKKEIADGLALLKSFGHFFDRPWVQCFLAGEWSLAQLDTQLNLGGTTVVIPYGVSVCLTSECATQLSDPATWQAEWAAWGNGVSALAALSPTFGAAMASLVSPAPYVAAGIATGGAMAAPAIVGVAAIILGVILWVLLYGTALSAQFWLQSQFTNNFADGKVCLEHPTFALALITMATIGFGSFLNLIPPIVTG
jgi:hypothetical protein